MKINRTSKIFQKLEFLKDQYEFHLLIKMLDSRESLFSSDEETYIIGRDSVGFPIWIWTIDGISNEKVKELEGKLKYFFLPGDNSITCKQELYHHLAKDYQDTSDYFQMGFLMCDKLNDIEKSQGYIDKPNYGDKTLLAKYWIDDRKEAADEDISMTEALEEVEYWLDKDNFYVWRNTLGKAVATASFDIMNDQAKLTNVYTAKDERCKGYCTSLVSEITAMILKQNLIPLLYTNNKIASNHAYHKVGYEEKGSLISMTITIDKDPFKSMLDEQKQEIEIL